MTSLRMAPRQWSLQIERGRERGIEREEEGEEGVLFSNASVCLERTLMTKGPWRPKRFVPLLCPLCRARPQHRLQEGEIRLDRAAAVDRTRERERRGEAEGAVDVAVKDRGCSGSERKRENAAHRERERERESQSVCNADVSQ